MTARGLTRCRHVASAKSGKDLGHGSAGARFSSSRQRTVVCFFGLFECVCVCGKVCKALSLLATPWNPGTRRLTKFRWATTARLQGVTPQFAAAYIQSSKCEPLTCGDDANRSNVYVIEGPCLGLKIKRNLRKHAKA